MSALVKRLRSWRLGLQLLAVALLVAAQWQCAAPAREGAAESATGASGGNRANADAGDGGDRDSGTSGSGGAPGGIRCADAGSEPVVLASNVGATGSIALDQDNVYWTWGSSVPAGGEGGGCPMSPIGAVLSVPKCGGRVTTLATNQAWPDGIAVTSTGIYWANSGACSGDGSIMALPRDGETPMALATAQEQPLALVANAQSVYWGNYDPDPPYGDTIRQISIAGGADQVRASNTDPECLALDSENVYWIEREGAVNKVALSHGAPVRLATANDPAFVAVSEGVVYWLDSSGIWSVASEGGESHLVFVPPDLYVAGLAVDMTDIYWTDSPSFTTATGTVNVVSKNGGALRQIAIGQADPSSIVVDANYIYWLNRGTSSMNLQDGAVMRLAK
jgi:hypothetical protein